MPISSGANNWPNRYVGRGKSGWKKDDGKSGDRYSRKSNQPKDQPPPPPYKQPNNGPDYGPCCCYCGGSPTYTTGVAGGNTGFFQGGMFSGRKSPVKDSDYPLQGSGRHRCCTIIWGSIIGLVLLALILGLVLGLDPYLKQRSALSQLQQDYPGGYYQDGIYYFPVSDPPDIYYLVLGPGEPCNPYNNASSYHAATVSYDTYSDPTTDTILVTDAPIILANLPDCDSLTTVVVLSANFSTTAGTTTTTLATPNSATGCLSSILMTALMFVLTMG